jgi:invasion protein IalB
MLRKTLRNMPKDGFLNMRFAVAAGLLVVLLAVGVAVWPGARPAVPRIEPAAGGTAAPGAEKAAPASGSWATRCEDQMKDGQKAGTHCEAFLRLAQVRTDDDGNKKARRVMELAIGYSPDKKDSARAVIILPLGIDVQEDVGLAVDGRELTTFRVRYCDNRGCVGATPLTAAQVMQLRGGRELTVVARIASGSRKIALEVSLKGLDDALKAVRDRA